MGVTNTMSPFLSDVLATVRAGLTTDVAMAILAPGALVALDDCCGGQLWVRLASVEPVNSSTSWNDCGVLYEVLTVEVGIDRCAATLDSQGRAPRPEAITADAVQEHQDMLDIYAALRCSGTKFRNYVWTPSGPEGGCVGGNWSVQTTMQACAC